MATLNGIGEITLVKQLNTLLTLNTNGKYMDQDPQFRIGVLSGAAAAGSAAASADVESGGSSNIQEVIGTKTTTEPSSGYYIKIGATGTGNSQITAAGWMDAGTLATASATQTYYFPIQTALVSASGINIVSPSVSVSGTNVSLSNTDNGISISVTGGGTATAEITATSTQAGYIPSGETLDSETVNAPSATTSTSTYISGVTLDAPETGIRTFTVTVPNGDSTQLITFTVDSNRNVTVS